MNDNLVWIVDDDPIFRLIFSMTIKKVKNHLSIFEFENGRIVTESLQKAIEDQKDIPFCIFMDVNMPDINGWDCLDEINDLYEVEKPALTKIFIMSSSINVEDERRVSDYPFVAGYLRKPISIEMFKKVLGEKIGRADTK